MGVPTSFHGWKKYSTSTPTHTHTRAHAHTLTLPPETMKKVFHVNPQHTYTHTRTHARTHAYCHQTRWKKFSTRTRIPNNWCVHHSLWCTRTRVFRQQNSCTPRSGCHILCEQQATMSMLIFYNCYLQLQIWCLFSLHKLYFITMRVIRKNTAETWSGDCQILQYILKLLTQSSSINHKLFFIAVRVIRKNTAQTWSGDCQILQYILKLLTQSTHFMPAHCRQTIT